MKQKTKNIGIGVATPKKNCDDVKCPFHGKLSVRGKVIEGVVVSAREPKTTVIEREYLHRVPKYERYERRHSRIVAYRPACIDVEVGDTVKIAECRSLSKTKAFVVVENVTKTGK